MNATPSSMMVTFHKEQACSGLGPNQGFQSKERLKKSQLIWAILIQFDNFRLYNLRLCALLVHLSKNLYHYKATNNFYHPLISHFSPHWKTKLTNEIIDSTQQLGKK